MDERTDQIVMAKTR